MSKQMFTVAISDPYLGVTLRGLFEEEADALAYAEKECRSEMWSTWWILEIEPA